MKHQVQNTIKALVMIATLFVSTEVLAAGPCPNEIFGNDNILDLTAIKNELEQSKAYDEMDETQENAKYDLRRKVDRQNIQENDPMYALNAIGKVTAATIKEGEKGFTNFVKEEEKKSWGTGFMISPCHMITNHHVVCEKEKVNGKNICKSSGKVNKHANFSFGENDNGTDFRNRLTGEVIESDSNLEYAIVKIGPVKNEKGEISDKKIPFLLPNFKSVSGLNQVVSAGGGYPAQSSNQNNHKMYAMKSVLSPNGARLEGKITFTPGNSGSPTYYLDGGRLWASGIAAEVGFDSNGDAKINSKPRMINFPTIKDDLIQKNPTLLKEIVSSIKSGQCK